MSTDIIILDESDQLIRHEGRMRAIFNEAKKEVEEVEEGETK